jgi:hypothetical protein
MANRKLVFICVTHFLLSFCLSGMFLAFIIFSFLCHSFAFSVREF